MSFSLIRSEVSKVITINEDEFVCFQEEMEIVKLKKGEIWEKKGRIACYAGFVNHGVLRAYKSDGDHDFIHDFYMEKDFIGNYISYQNQQPIEIEFAAIEDCEVIRFPFKSIETLSQKSTTFKKFNDHIARKKEKYLLERATSLLSATAETRYKIMLDERPELLRRIPQYYLAQYLGISPISLSRIRKRIS